MSSNPIGIFDSGVGGTTVWKEIHRLLPNEPTVYLADSMHAPYGKKTPEEIIQLSFKNTEIIVVACNTATTNAIKILREKYSIPFVGIEPAIKPAALKTQTKIIGVLATRGTINSSLFHQASENYAKDIQIIQEIDRGLVELIEANKIHTPETRALLKKSLHAMLEAGADHIVLGCTHFPYLIEEIRKIIPAHITITDSGLAVAQRVKSVLLENNLTTPTSIPSYQFYTNTDTTTLEMLLQAYQNKISISYLDF
jgi:glutamate racemase